MLQDPKFWVAASFVIFVLLVGKTAWSRATSMLDARGDRIRAELEEASRLRAEAAQAGNLGLHRDQALFQQLLLCQLVRHAPDGRVHLLPGLQAGVFELE